MTVWKNSPEQSYNQIQVRNYGDIIHSSAPSLAGMRKELGDMHTKAVLTIILLDVIKFFNVGKGMNDIQVGQTVQLIQDEYWMLKPDDFKLCFNNAKKGMYGQVYDRLDGQIIMSWLNKHLEGRMSYSENEQIRKHDQLKKQDEQVRNQQLQNDKEKNREIQRIAVESYINNQKQQQ